MDARTCCEAIRRDLSILWSGQLVVWERVYLFYLILVQLARKAAIAIEPCPGKRALFSGSRPPSDRPSPM